MICRSDSDTASKVKSINRKRRATMLDRSDSNDGDEDEKHHDDESAMGHKPKSNIFFKCYF